MNAIQAINHKKSETHIHGSWKLPQTNIHGVAKA